MSSLICAGFMHVTRGIKGREIVENYTERDSYFYRVLLWCYLLFANLFAVKVIWRNVFFWVWKCHIDFVFNNLHLMDSLYSSLRT